MPNRGATRARADDARGIGMIRLLVCALALGIGMTPSLAGTPLPAQSPESRTRPMQFNWRQETENCGKQCRTWISAVGAITAETPRDFEAFAQGRDVRGATLVLDSDGGSVLGALSLGRTVRRHNMVTTVGRTVALSSVDVKEAGATLLPRADCESMCAFVLLSGVRRYVPTEARVLVHQIWLGDRRDDATAASYSAEDLVLVQRDIGKIAQFTVEMGGNIDLLETALRIPPWEPMRALSREELRRMRLHTADNPFTPLPVEQPVTNSSLTATAPGPSASINERGWSLVDQSGQSVLARRHPLTIEGEEIGRFDVTLACNESAEAYTVTYSERRRLREGQRGSDPLKSVTVAVGGQAVALKVVSSDRILRPLQMSSVARGTLPASLVESLAESSGRSVVISTTSRANTETSIRVGNTGVAEGLTNLSAGCGRKTTAAH